MAATAPNTVEVKVGKHIPKLNAKPGDTIKVTSEMASSLKSRRMLFEQVQEDQAGELARVQRSSDEKDNATLEAHRRMVRDLEAKLQASREDLKRTTEERDALKVGLNACQKAREIAEGALIKERASRP